jgi:xanthine dehydrogenase YagT iron-sulfur-binding subunit
MALDLLTPFVSIRLIALRPATPKRMESAPPLAGTPTPPDASSQHSANPSSEELHIAMRHINVPPSSNPDPESFEAIKPSRRRFLQSAAAAAAVTVAPLAHPQQPATATTSAPPPSSPGTAAPLMPVKLTINGHAYEMQLEARTTLLDALREYASLTGTKKGCDRGQCGACTVIANGRRINSCLTLAVMHEGESIVTVEGLANAQTLSLSLIQKAFIDHDAFQCGFCTSGQLCSATALIDEFHAGDASAVTADVRFRPPQLSDDEIRERMSGNICRCGAYPNIVAAVKTVALVKA